MTNLRYNNYIRQINKIQPRKGGNTMDATITYTCPKADSCPIHKHCHVLTTAEEISVAIPVLQQCLVEEKNTDGTVKEILIYIGKVV